MTTASTASDRNADLRLLLQVTYPDHRFSVRNGKNGSARVSWTDGPDRQTVYQLLRTVPAHAAGYVGQSWSVDEHRTYSRAFIAAACLKAAAGGVDFYGEREERGLVLARWSCVWENLDAADLPAEFLRAGEVLAAMTPAGSKDDEESGKTMAAAVFHHGAAALAALSAS